MTEERVKELCRETAAAVYNQEMKGTETSMRQLEDKVKLEIIAQAQKSK